MVGDIGFKKYYYVFQLYMFSVENIKYIER